MDGNSEKLNISEITNFFVMDSLEFVKCVDKLYNEYSNMNLSNKEIKEIISQINNSITSMIDFSEILETHEETLGEEYKGLFKKVRNILKAALKRSSTFMDYKKLAESFIYSENRIDVSDSNNESPQKQIINNYSNFIGDKINDIKETLEETPKKRRGRPPKNKEAIKNKDPKNIDSTPAKSWVPNLPKDVQDELKNSDPVQKKRRGRPPKVKPVEEVKVEEKDIDDFTKVKVTEIEEKPKEKKSITASQREFVNNPFIKSEMISESEKRDIKIQQSTHTMGNGNIKMKDPEVTDEGYHVVNSQGSLNITRKTEESTSAGVAAVKGKYANIFNKKK